MQLDVTKQQGETREPTLWWDSNSTVALLDSRAPQQCNAFVSPLLDVLIVVHFVL